MFPEIKRILFTSDLTETSKFAFSYAVSLASHYCAEVVFLYVMEEVPHSAKGFLDQETLERIRSRARDSAKTSLSEKRQDISMIQSELSRFCENVQNSTENGARRFTANEVVVTEGNVVDQILLTAEDYDCDTIAMGSTRHGLLSQGRLGSVVNGVLKRSSRLVVVAPPLPKKHR